MISLLYSGNDNVFRGLLISLLSVAKHTAQPLDVHVLTMDLTDIDEFYRPVTEQQTAFLQDLLQRQNPENKVTRHDVSDAFLKEMGQSPNLHSAYTPYTFLRLFCDDLEIPDKILYLDTDTAALKDLAPLFETELDGYDFAGVQDYLGRFFISRTYINAGMLLLNLGQMRKNGFLKQARQLCAVKKMAFPDQDAINRLEKNKYFLPRCYNEQKEIRPDTVVRHFSKTIRWLPFFHTVNIKPWDVERLHSVYRCHELDDVLQQYLQAMECWNENVKAAASM